MPSDNTDDAIHPKMVKSITAKALMGVKPPNNIPQNNKGSAASANTERLAMVGVMTAKTLVRINGIKAFHDEAPLPKRKSYWALLCCSMVT